MSKVYTYYMMNGIHLTPREKQILAILRTTAPGNKIIARQLKLSESTVKLHMSNLLRKYGVKNRSQLVLFATSQ